MAKGNIVAIAQRTAGPRFQWASPSTSGPRTPDFGQSSTGAGCRPRRREVFRSRDQLPRGPEFVEAEHPSISMGKQSADGKRWLCRPTGQTSVRSSLTGVWTFPRSGMDRMSGIEDQLLSLALTTGRNRRIALGVNAHSRIDARSKHKSNQRSPPHGPIPQSDRSRSTIDLQGLWTAEGLLPVKREHATVRNLLRNGPPDLDGAYYQLRWLLPWLDTGSRRLLRSDPTLLRAMWLLVAAQGTGHKRRDFWARRRRRRYLGIGAVLCAALSLLLILSNTLQATRYVPAQDFRVAGEMPTPFTASDNPAGDHTADP